MAAHIRNSLTSGDNNIYIGNDLPISESNTIRIGTAVPAPINSTPHTQTFIGGIGNANVSGAAVVIDPSTGQLGIVGSSARFKHDIRDMEDTSAGLFSLCPVTFRYKPEYSAGGSESLQYGLIAEEVAQSYPELVQLGTDGKPLTVQYHLLTPMLLNELQKLHALAESAGAD